MLCKMAFSLSNKVVALHLDNSTVKACLCYQGGTVSLFLQRLACHFNLADKHGITFITVHIHTHLIVEADHLSWGHLFLEWYPCIFTLPMLHFIFEVN